MPGWARWWAPWCALRRLAGRQAGRRRVTLWNFVVMALAVVGVLIFLPSGPAGGQLRRLLPVLPGAVPDHRHRQRLDLPHDPGDLPDRAHARVNRNDGAAVAQATKEANTEAAATLGFTAAMAAYGGFFIPKSYGSSIALTGGPEAALYIFIAFYLICIAVTWWHYARRNAPMPC
jgi:NNP family nitrate/nitrite transporter-like MFS transporter